MGDSAASLGSTDTQATDGLRTRENWENTADAASIQQNLLLTGQAVAIHEAFSDTVGRVLMVKGPALASLVAGTLAGRKSIDLDVLIAPGTADAAEASLAKLGYQPMNDPAIHRLLRSRYKEMPFGHKTWPIVVELHQRLCSPWLAAGPRFEELWERRQTVRVAGHDLPTLGNEDYLVYLSIHGCGHLWTEEKWINDIDQLLRKRGEVMDWHAVREIAIGWHCRRMLHTALLLCDRLRSTPMPDDSRTAARADTVATQRCQFVVNRGFSGQHAPITQANGLRLQLRLLDRRSDRLRMLLHQFFLPTSFEMQLIRLPRPLWPAYAVIRPARLIVKYTPTIGRAAARVAMRPFRRIASLAATARRLTVADRRLLLSAIRTVYGVRFRLWLQNWPKVRQWAGRQSVEHRRASAPAVARILWAVHAASRRTPRGSHCLTRAIAAYIILRRHGYPAEIHIGVNPDTSAGFAAHAWVELAGKTVLGGSDVPYQRLTQVALDADPPISDS